MISPQGMYGCHVAVALRLRFAILEVGVQVVQRFFFI